MDQKSQPVSPSGLNLSASDSLHGGSFPASDDHGWWDTPGWELCPSCQGRFNLEVEIRCTYCDSPLCPLCAIEITITPVYACSGCADNEA